MMMMMKMSGFAAAVLLAGCNATVSAPSATATAAAASTPTRSSAEARVDGVVVTATAMPASQINAESAKQYGISTAGDDLLLLVTLRDAQGNAVPADAVVVEAKYAALPAPLAPLALRSINVNGLTDLMAVVPAKPPATISFELVVKKGGSSSTMQFTRDVLPR